MQQESYCGYIALVGRPNVGKSTLLNRLLGQKISITSRKPQTTRHRILGIRTDKPHQYVYVDTPGIHEKKKNAMNRLMNKAAFYAIHDVDVICFVVDGLHFREEDEMVLNEIKKTEVPVILAINKVDKIANKAELLTYIDSIRKRHNFSEIVPISAKGGDNVDSLEETFKSYLPKGPHLFYDHQLTDRSTRFVISEFIREKVFRLSGQELPYATSVEIEKMETDDKLCKIHALILVERDSHKRMIIGKNGTKLKEIGTDARKSIEILLDKKVYLSLWVKVKQGWSDDERILKQLGYDD